MSIVSSSYLQQKAQDVDDHNCKGPYTCSSLLVDYDERMMDLKFIAITLGTYVRTYVVYMLRTYVKFLL